MIFPTKIKISLISSALLSVAGITLYVVIKRILNVKNAKKQNNLTIKIITSEETCDDVIFELRRRSSQHHAIGFDCEWVTEEGNRHPVALLQLSTFDGYCALFRLNHLKEFPNSLNDLLKDDNIYKVGVAPFSDGQYLAKDYGVNLKGTLDLRHLVDLCGYETGGLAFLSESLLGIVLDKSWRVRCSNWEAEELTESQISYAAADAHVAIQIFVKLINDYHKAGSLFSLWMNNSNIHRDSVKQICFKYLDVCYKTSHKVKKNVQKNGVKNSTVTYEAGKERVLCGRNPYTTRTDICVAGFLQKPNGDMLCTCDADTVNWYIERGQAYIVTEEPLTVRLRFEPRSEEEEQRWAEEKKCVVCGANDSNIKKNIIPYDYRKHFPDVMKDTSPHYIVVLCKRCHELSITSEQGMRDHFALVTGAPRAVHGAGFVEDKDNKKVRAAARALLSKKVIPEKRRKELEAVIVQYLNEGQLDAQGMCPKFFGYQLLVQRELTESITDELLTEVVNNIEVMHPNFKYEVHFYEVVEYYQEIGAIDELREECMKHFLTSMCPQYMPEHWSVRRNEDRFRCELTSIHK